MPRAQPNIMLKWLIRLAGYCDGGRYSVLPSDGRLAVWRFYFRMKDIHYIETGRDVGLAYDLAKHGLIKDLGGERYYEVTEQSWATDHEPDFLQRISKAAAEWREARTQPQDKVEKHLTTVLEHHGWPRAYEQAVMRNSVVSAWSAFEALATDLWAAAIEGAPELLKNVLISDDVQKDTYLQIRKAIGSGIGEILARKMAMKTVPAIKKAYATAFAPEEFAYLSEQQNPTLKELEKTRHLLVHCGGVVDHEFLKASGMTATVNEELELNREHVHELIASAMEAGLKLIMFAKDWFYPYVNS